MHTTKMLSHSKKWQNRNKIEDMPSGISLFIIELYIIKLEVKDMEYIILKEKEIKDKCSTNRANRKRMNNRVEVAEKKQAYTNRKSYMC